MPSLNTGNAILSNPIKVDSSYNVGIGGAASGSFKLQVTGTTNLTGALTGTTSAFTTRVDIGTRSSGNIRNLNIYGATNGNAIIKLDGADGNGYGAQIDFISKTSGGTSNNWTLGTGITGGTNAFELFNGTSTVFNLTTTGAATFSSSVSAATNFRLNSASFSQVAILDGGGGFAGGYNFNINSGTAQHDSTGASSGYWYQSDGQISFFANSSASAGTALSPRMRITSGGNVGIGTSSPFAIADINTSINGTGSSALQLGVGGTRIAQFFATSGEVRLSAVSNVPMLFYTSDTERMRITSDGNVGIGNSNPQNYGSTYVSLTIGSSTRIGILKFRSSYNSGDGAEIYQTTSGAIIFNINGSTSGASISSGGVFNIVNLAGSGSRAVLADASGNLSAPVSDISVKQNITSIGYGLNEILKMNPVWFDFIDEYKNYGEGRQNGNIAQEMQEIIPEAVFVTPSTGKMGINYDQMHAVYIKAIQEQTQIIKDLEARIKQLENK